MGQPGYGQDMVDGGSWGYDAAGQYQETSMDWTSFLDTNSMQILAGVADSGATLGQDWSATNTAFMNNMFSFSAAAENTPLQAISAGMTAPPAGVLGSIWADSKEVADKFWTTINNPANETGVTLGALFLNGMLSQSTRERQTKAMERTSQASMLNAQTNANALALQQQKLENASSIKNTNFGQMQTPKFQDLLAPRRARNTGLIDIEV